MDDIAITKTRRRFAIASVLQRTMLVLRDGVGTFYCIGLLSAFSSLVVGYILKYDGKPSGDILIRFLVSANFSMLFFGSISYAAYHILNGNTVHVDVAVLRGISSLWSIVGVQIFMGLAYGAWAVVALVLTMACIQGFKAEMDTFFFPLLLTFLIPIFYLYCCWFIAIPVGIVEKLGALKSIFKSSDLTNGCRLTIAGLIILSWAVAVLTDVLCGYFFTANIVRTSWLLIIVQFIKAIPIAFHGVLAAMVYYELRLCKEGVTPRLLIDVFE